MGLVSKQDKVQESTKKVFDSIGNPDKIPEIKNALILIDSKGQSKSEEKATESLKEAELEIILTNEENERFETFKVSLNAIISDNHKFILQYPRKVHERAEKELSELTSMYENYSQRYNREINNYVNFMKWVEDNPSKKRQLIEAFNIAYDFIENKRQKYAPDKTINQYITSAISWNGKKYLSKKDDYNVSNNGMYGPTDPEYNSIHKFFLDVMSRFSSGNDYYIGFNVPKLYYEADKANNNYKDYMRFFNAVSDALSGARTTGSFYTNPLSVLKRYWRNDL
ncbi:Mlp family lipoprotein [Borrelia miyamotoi]|uniref:Mlp family lipoprotein n=1 Tax=Borrelia miyamotoi TaxID=47466 RepID=UPI00237FA3F9|nr:Mlp family lipoprotein [Borrelia miyamotoi]WDS47341.1 Mlp family lipoprotein [Borrelia miyamotoi]